MKVSNRFKRKKAKKRNKTIRTRFILLFTSIVFIPIVIVSVALFLRMEKAVTQRVMTEQRDATSGVVEIFESIKSEANNSLAALSEVPDVKNAAGGEDRDDLQQLISTIQAASEYISDVFIYLPESQTLSTRETEAVLESTDEWLEETLSADGEIVYSQPYSDVVTSATTMAATMEIEQSNGETSILGVQLDMGSIAQVVDNKRIGETGHPFVITDRGYWQFTQDASRAGLDLTQDPLFLDATEETGELFNDLNGQSYPIYYERVPDMNLIVYGHVTADEIATERAVFMESASRVIVLSIIGAIIIALFFSNYLVQVTRTIQYALGDLQQGKLKTRLTSYKNKKKNPKKINKKKLNSFKENGDELHQIGLSFNQSLTTIDGAVTDIKRRSKSVDDMASDLSEITEQTKRATEEVSEAIQTIAHSSSLQTKDTRETVSQMDELAEYVTAISENMQEVGKHADQTVISLGENDQNMNQVNHTWDQTVHSVNDLKRDIGSVDEKVQDVESILRAIQNISEQTNLLALNASIEAARAGEAGKGFSVVAEEIRKLADKSHQSSDMIAGLISEIQSESSVMVNTLDRVLADSSKQTSSLTKVTKTNDDISLKIQELAVHISKSLELARSVEDKKSQVVQSLDKIETAAESNAASTEEVSANSEEILASMEEFSASIEQLKMLAGNLRDATNHFS
ncbi:methyl-accepting chemotaxis sensory transducer with Cache sensor [Alkalibacterium putridalgicola]|uniref:Methyl-accepting chemotaxis protein n=1 Tax=Alkalibacterium putridalgicola TaxID=426703 RepID=A0A1H7RD45_9LACT|nr:methyl-accepting chemotaxis protein [Alkalibacterium putridalgicola]GEK88814.1 methyl-accepting chemotaxis protein [Alkalibacterium putridalgicola]SEL57915.1 methyl-accepting chemotaxis sensory transducer with Cache sensor [Alkalibacterium putridalgicola]